MLRREHVDGAQQIVALFAFRQHGENQNQRSMMQTIAQRGGEREIVGVAILRCELARVRRERAQMRGAARGRKSAIRLGVEGQNADLVLHPIADVAEQHRGVDGVIESRDLFDARGHAMSAIDADENFLRAIESVFANDETPVSR